MAKVYQGLTMVGLRLLIWEDQHHWLRLGGEEINEMKETMKEILIAVSHYLNLPTDIAGYWCVLNYQWSIFPTTIRPLALQPETELDGLHVPTAPRIHITPTLHLTVYPSYTGNPTIQVEAPRRILCREANQIKWYNSFYTRNKGAEDDVVHNQRNINTAADGKDSNQIPDLIKIKTQGFQYDRHKENPCVVREQSQEREIEGVEQEHLISQTQPQEKAEQISHTGYHQEGPSACDKLDKNDVG
ncbi:hypothetical protein FHL15_011035 [Xylaria flabelliformis]|uniref:Uncharacterized protein n=1 Tax=Xylaria flabelliformis TaxID=2512241 RepID=A0A553HJF9_9PEZI|nr:hypothetical protein FHL15_011035 [Xylaria flabelliformis]